MTVLKQSDGSAACMLPFRNKWKDQILLSLLSASVDNCHVGCDAVWSGGYVLTFQKDLLPPSQE